MKWFLWRYGHRRTDSSKDTTRLGALVFSCGAAKASTVLAGRRDGEEHIFVQDGGVGIGDFEKYGRPKDTKSCCRSDLDLSDETLKSFALT